MSNQADRLRQFSNTCERRLSQKGRQGYTGWDDKKLACIFRNEIRMIVSRRLTPKKLVDLANYSFFLWNFATRGSGQLKIPL